MPLPEDTETLLFTDLVRRSAEHGAPRGARSRAGIGPSHRARPGHPGSQGGGWHDVIMTSYWIPC